MKIYEEALIGCWLSAKIQSLIFDRKFISRRQSWFNVEGFLFDRKEKIEMWLIVEEQIFSRNYIKNFQEAIKTLIKSLYFRLDILKKIIMLSVYVCVCVIT